VLDAGVVIGERGVKFLNRYAVLFVSIFHAPNIHLKAYLRQGDNSVVLRNQPLILRKGAGNQKLGPNVLFIDTARAVRFPATRKRRAGVWP
jgi:hypothetical protein